MTGLIWKDLLVLRKQLKSYLIILALYLVMAALGLFPISVVSAVLEIVLLMLPLSAFSYDEMSHWDRYAAALPVGRRTMVAARYLFTLGVALLAAVVGLACSLLFSLFSGEPVGENLVAVVVCLGIGLFYADILLPLCYKLGPERARPWLYVVIFLPIVLILGAYYLGALDALDALPDPVLVALGILIPLLPLAGIWVSYRLSCSFLERKEL